MGPRNALASPRKGTVYDRRMGHRMRTPRVPRVLDVEFTHLMPRCWASGFARKLLSGRSNRCVTSEKWCVTGRDTAL
jgi:hypothetical protein